MKKLVFLSLLMLFNCKSDLNSHFDSKVWKNNSSEIFLTDYREKMVDDLIQSDTLIKLKYQEVVNLLGEPYSISDYKITYLIREKYGRDIDPEYYSFLSLELDSSKKVVKCEILK